MRITVFGSGSWGTALSIILARNGHDVAMLGRNPEEVESILNHRENLQYLPGFAIPDSVKPGLISDPTEASDAWILAVPTVSIPQVLPHIVGDSPIIIVASKGLIPGSGQIISDYVQDHIPSAQVAAISGPNLAVEIARGVPTLAVVASPDEQLAERIALLFNCPKYRIYISDDLRGIEVAGALKNVYGLTAGIADGLGYGDNTKGALLSRALYEMVKLGVPMGGRVDTFFGIAGVGDLFATANSKLSRNYRCGFALGQGHSLERALDEVGQIVEGVPTCEVASARARVLGVNAPIIECTYNVVMGRLQPRDGVALLMEKLPRREGVLSALEDSFKS
ncbi:MAG: NAD(P)-dependent glycerol-3-phosphate dehydrogenase [Armatimonadetes bacterium]|nr:NAD(P)-dependent glycerol-3-phosphate dehydrogenase [Armatimonadota bacterium]